MQVVNSPEWSSPVGNVFLRPQTTVYSYKKKRVCNTDFSSYHGLCFSSRTMWRFKETNQCLFKCQTAALRGLHNSISSAFQQIPTGSMSRIESKCWSENTFIHVRLDKTEE